MDLIHQTTLFLAVIWCFVTLVEGHPQCLDFGPPFEVKGGLGFCNSYSSFGCCTKDQDVAIKSKYDAIVRSLDKSGSADCKQVLKDILCQTCSPYAAHLFDVETGAKKRPLPGMCTNYCERLYNRCLHLVQHLTDEPAMLNKLGSVQSFCVANQIPDPMYCYPDILQNTALNRDIERSVVSEEGCLCLQKFADKMKNPLLLLSPPDNTRRIFIGEQIGVVYVFDRHGTKLATFMDISKMVLVSSRRGDERGFLGMAFHPGFKTNRKVYIYYSVWKNRRQYTRLSEVLVMDSDPNQVDINSERILMELRQPYSNHNGGMLMFGIDGYLYLFTGDGGAGGDPQGNGQKTRSLLGKALRIDVNGTEGRRPYKIPQDNPFVGNSSFSPEIYAYGIRNIWRCDEDEGHPITGDGRGDIICGDVGQSKWEEIDLIKKGANYGWNIKEGPECFTDCERADNQVLEEPIHSYRHGTGDCSVTGGNVYRGCQSPNMMGHYIYGDFCSGNIWRLKENKTTHQWDNKAIRMCGDEYCFNGLLNSYEKNILSFGEDFDGEVYMLTSSNYAPRTAAGSVYKLVDPRRRGDKSTCRSSSWEDDPVPPKPSLQTTTTIPTTTAPFARPADVAITMDTSGDLGSSHWAEAVDLLKLVVTALEVENYGHRVGIVTYGSVPFLYKPLDTQDVQDTLRQLDSWKQSLGPLSYAKRYLLFDSINIPEYVIYITDSFTAQNETKMKQGAQELKDNNIELFVIVVGVSRGYFSELVQDYQHVITLSDAEDVGSSNTKKKLENLSTRVRGEIVKSPPGKPLHWNCNFDNYSAPFCDMEQVVGSDQFNWTLEQGSTPSEDTGPNKAHSPDSYIFIEASWPRLAGDIADINIPAVPGTGDYCFQVFYNMFGHHTGSLLVYAMTSGGTKRILRRRDGQQHENGASWSVLRENVQLETGSKIGLRGLCGKGYSGDISVDSITLNSGIC